MQHWALCTLLYHYTNFYNFWTTFATSIEWKKRARRKSMKKYRRSPSVMHWLAVTRTGASISVISHPKPTWRLLNKFELSFERYEQLHFNVIPCIKAQPQLWVYSIEFDMDKEHFITPYMLQTYNSLCSLQPANNFFFISNQYQPPAIQ